MFCRGCTIEGLLDNLSNGLFNYLAELSNPPPVLLNLYLIPQRQGGICENAMIKHLPVLLSRMEQSGRLKAAKVHYPLVEYTLGQDESEHGGIGSCFTPFYSDTALIMEYSHESKQLQRMAVDEHAEKRVLQIALA